MLSDHLRTERPVHLSHLDTRMDLKKKYHTHVANWYPMMASGGCRKKKTLPSVDEKTVASVQQQMMTYAEYAVMAYVKHMVTAYNSYLAPELLHTKAHRCWLALT